MKGVFQLKAKGIQDEELTGAPTIDFIKQVYKRHVNFSIEPIQINFKDQVNFGKKCSVIIPNNYGDLINKMYLHLHLPKLTKTSGNYVGWTNSIGHAIIDYVDLEIDGKLIQRHHSEFLEIQNELHVRRDNTDKLIGKYLHLPLLETNAIEETNYIVPLWFFFNQDISSSLPVIALYHSEIKIVFKFKKFEECVVYDGISPPSVENIKSASVYVDYICLDDVERYYYKVSPHKLLLSQTQYVIGESVNSGGIHASDLPFNNPVYEIIFVLREIDSDNNNDWFNFSKRNSIINTEVSGMITDAKLIFDNFERTDYLPENVLSTLNSKKYHTNCTDKHIYIMPLCDKPESSQPSGSINMSMIDSSRLYIKLKQDINPSKIYIFAKNWNICRIENGLFKIEWLC
jgi:hypothetical protein